MEYNADKNFLTKILTVNPGYKLYIAKEAKWDLVLGARYSIGTRDTDMLSSNTYLAPEFLFNFNTSSSNGLVLKNAFKAVYLQDDNGSLVEVDKAYLYNKLSLELKVFGEDSSNKYSTIGINYEVGRRAPLFQELNTISLVLSLYLDI